VNDRNKGSVVALGDEFYIAVLEREQGVILAHADILTGEELGSALTNDDVASEDLLAAELLDAKAPTVGIATVARRTA